MANGWKNKRVTVMGLGRFGGGVGVTRWLARQGARVTVTDLADAEALRGSVDQIADCGAALRLGGHREADFRDTDLVVASPAVPPSSPFLNAAREAGVEISTEISLFVQNCRARAIGVTGSVGKSTITAMIGHVLTHTLPPPRRVWVGGNIGRSLLLDLPEIGDDSVVVLELSSFQLEMLAAARWSPHVAVVTGVTPNHLDRHGTFAAYLAAKLNIVRFQDPARDAIVMLDHPDLRDHFSAMFGDLAGIWRYGLRDGTPVAALQSTSAVESDDRRLSWPGLALDVPGAHNRLNAAAALTVAHVMDIDAAAAVAALRSFEALPHRLQRVAEVAGVVYFNDSKSTTPESAQTAMAAIERPLLMLLGGYDKGIDLAPLARLIAKRVIHAACIGQTGPRLCESIGAAGGDACVYGSLADAVQACRERARAGDAVLLSPACASYGMFEDYRARGDAFTQLVRHESEPGCPQPGVPA